MASIDSGVETGNESNDSNFTVDGVNKVFDEFSAIKVLYPSTKFPEIDTQENVSTSRSVVSHSEMSFSEIPFFLRSYRSENVINKICRRSEEPATILFKPYYPAEKHQNKIFLRSSSKCRHAPVIFNEILAEKRLRLAAGLNHTKTLRRLLEAGVNPKSTDSKRRTALHIAACKGHSEVVGLLLDNGADPNQKDIVGNTPLQVAAYTNHFKVILQLLKATALTITSVDESMCSFLRLIQTRMKTMLKDVDNASDNDQLKEILHESSQIFDDIFKHCSERAENDLIHGFSNQLKLKHAKDEGENTIRDVLSSLSELTLQKKD